MVGEGSLFDSSYLPFRGIGIVSVGSGLTRAAASVVFLPALLMGKPE